MKIEYVAIENLNPAEYNPRKLSPKETHDLEQSLKRFDFAEPIVVNRHPDRKNIIVGGHQRYNIAKSLGHKEIPCVFVSLDLKREQELNLRLNKNIGSWDWEMLANIDYGLLTDVGFEEDVLSRVFDLDIDDEDDEGDALTVPVEPKSKYRQIYQLGASRVMCGDATKPEDVKALMDGQRAEMVFTDPPYNVDYQGSMNAQGQNKRDGILNDKMEKSAFFTFLYNAIHNMMQYTDGAFYVCMSSSELDTLKYAFESAGGHWQSFIIWVKNTFTLSRADYQNRYEPIMYGWNPNIRDRHYFVDKRNDSTVWDEFTKTEIKLEGGKTIIKLPEFHLELEGEVKGKIIRKKEQTDIWEVNKPAKSPDHPTMKPVKLCAKAITNSSLRDHIVLDLFAGSGSTLIAAEKAKRRCFAMELDPKYVDVIIKRWENLTGEEAKHINA